MSTIEIKADRNNLSDAIDFIKNEMEKKGCKSREINSSLLICEETLVATIGRAKENSTITINVKNRLGKLILDITSAGEKFNVAEAMNKADIPISDVDDSQTEYFIRTMLIKHYAERIKYSRKGDTNYVRIILDKDAHYQVKLTMFSMLAAVLIGLIFRFVMPDIGTVINEYFCSPVSNIFIKCMRCVVGPIVFLSILCSIIGFDDIRVLGRIGAKVMALYTMTSVVATVIGIGISYVFDVGELGSYIPQNVSEVEQTGSSSVIDMIIAMFPDNFFAAFLNNDTIQLIVIAVACGIALNAMGERNESLKECINALSEMVSTVCSYISKVIPLVVICSISGLILTAESGTIGSLLQMTGVILLGMGIMVLVYCILLAVFVRVNPFIMLKKYLGTAITVFTLASSNATIPLNLEFSNKIGVSRKVSTFSIPLGATINMDGGCIFYPIATLYLCKIYGVTFSTTMLLQLFLLVIMVSMGTPGIAGGICALMIPFLSLAGVPAEIALLIMGIDTIIDMFRTVLNTLGDQTATLIAANSEGLFDREKYYSK